VANYTIRKIKDRLAFVLGVLALVLAMIPLGSILLEVVVRGLPAINLNFLTAPSRGIGLFGGGIGNSIQGTLIIIGLLSLIGIPLGVIAGIYLSEYGNTRLGETIRFFTDVLAGVPSIVAGLLGYLVVLLILRTSFSVIGATVALTALMLPILARSTEESLKLVPNSIREASMALGVRRWRTTLSVVLSQAKGGVVTGILLAIARIAGETAPLLLTIGGSSYFFTDFTSVMDALPYRIWTYSQYPYPQSIQQAWGAALVLISLVLLLNIGVRIITRGKYASLR
jgi:phosphate transport system permease protein